MYFWLFWLNQWGVNVNMGGWEAPEGVKLPNPPTNRALLTSLLSIYLGLLIVIILLHIRLRAVASCYRRGSIVPRSAGPWVDWRTIHRTQPTWLCATWRWGARSWRGWRSGDAGLRQRCHLCCRKLERKWHRIQSNISSKMISDIDTNTSNMNDIEYNQIYHLRWYLILIQIHQTWMTSNTIEYINRDDILQLSTIFFHKSSCQLLKFLACWCCECQFIWNFCSKLNCMICRVFVGAVGLRRFSWNLLRQYHFIYHLLLMQCFYFHFLYYEMMQSLE